MLLHGYSLAENPEIAGTVTNKKGEPVKGKFHDWNTVCISPDRPWLNHELSSWGRIPRAVALASELDVSQLIFSTGATWAEYQVSEARYMFMRACEILPLCARHRSELWLREIAVFEETSTNTFSTMEYVAKMLDTSSPMMLHHVTSANHAPRVMRDASKVFGEMQNVILSVVPADTSYGHKTPSDVVIHELGEPAKT